MIFRRTERGNVFTILLGGIVVSGALAMALYQMMSGPVTSTIRLAKQTEAQAMVQSVARMVIADAANQALNTASNTTSIPGDCDNDGMVEPRAWRTAPTAVHPIGDGTVGAATPGLIPLGIGAPLIDAWGTDYGYCAWDVGLYNDPTVDRSAPPTNSTCGVGGNRLKGSPTPTLNGAINQTVLAVISAGPDKAFQTTCNNWAATTTDLVTTTPSTSDDIVVRYTYAEAAKTTASLWNLKSGAPDVAATDKNMTVGETGSHKALTASSPVNSNSVATVGKVQSGGALKLGDQTSVVDALCDAGHVGLLRYSTLASSGAGALQYCSPTGWTVVSGGGGADPNTAQHIDVLGNYAADSKGLSDGKTDYAQGTPALYYVGLGSGALTAPPVGAYTGSTTNYSNPAIVQGPIAKQQASSTTSTYVFTQLPAAGNTVFIQLAATGPATNFTSVTVADNQGHTYTSAASIMTACTSKGAAGIYYYDYVAAPAAGLSVTVTVAPSAKMTWTMTEYSGILAASPVDIFNTAATAAAAANTTITATGTVAAAYKEVALAVHADCDTTDANTNMALNLAGSLPTTGWNADDFKEVVGNGAVASGEATHQILTSSVTNPKVRWTHDNAGTGHASAIAIFKPSVASVTNNYAAVNSTAVGWHALNSLLSGTGNSALGHNVLAANARSYGNTAAGAGVLSSATISTTITDPVINNGTYEFTVGSSSGFFDNNIPLTNSIAEGCASSNLNGAVDAIPIDGTHMDTNKTWTGAATCPSGFLSRGGNTAIGASILPTSTKSNFNTVIGASSLTLTTIDSHNLAIGYQVLPLNNGAITIESAMTGIGYQALAADQLGAYQTAIGHQALSLYNSVAGFSDFLIAFGYQSLKTLTSGDYIVAIGYNSGYLSTGTPNQENVAFGANANTKLPLTTAAFGYNALTVGTGTGNTAFGYSALAANVSDQDNVAFGYNALAALNKGATATGHTAFGYNALAGVTTGTMNTAFGYNALSLNIGATSTVTAFGSAASGNVTAPSLTTAIGSSALLNDAGAGDTGIGYQALKGSSASGGNTAVGYQALSSNTGTRNTAFGAFALATNTSGNDNTAVGYKALASNVTGSFNTAAGYQALMNNTSDYNTAAGAEALENNKAGTRNTAIGDSALMANIDGSDNTAIGYQALANNDGVFPVVVQTTAVVSAPAGNMGSGGTTTASVSFGVLPQAGNTIIIFSMASDGALGPCNDTGPSTTITDNQGGTSGSYLSAAISAVSNCTASHISYRPNISAPSGTFTVTITPTRPGGQNSNIYIAAMEVSGLAASGALDQAATGQSVQSGGTTTAVTTGATSQANELAVGSVTESCPDQVATFVPAAGWTEDRNVNPAPFTDWPISIIHKAVISGGPVTHTWTHIAGDNCSPNEGVIATFRTAVNGATADAGNHNTAWGAQALLSNLGGDGNTAFGYQALMGNTTGAYNTSGGAQSLLANTTGSNNVAFGYQALKSSVTDSAQIAIGYQALSSSNKGATNMTNIAIGDSALFTSVTDTANTAVGYRALRLANIGNTPGNNTAIGASALSALTTGTGNTAVGASALLNVTTGNNNTAVGNGAGPVASYNTAISAAATNGAGTPKVRLTVTSSAAFVAGDYVMISGCTSAGINGARQISVAPAVPANGIIDGTHVDLTLNWTGGWTCPAGTMTSNISNTTTLGNAASVSHSNNFRIGDTTAGTKIGAFLAGITTYSDRRLKKDIKDSDLGLDFIMNLKPVSYHRIGGRDRLEYGFIAQDVEQALGGRETNMVNHDMDLSGTYGITATELIGPLVRALQQQQETEKKQQEEVDDLHKRLDRLKAELAETPHD